MTAYDPNLTISPSFRIHPHTASSKADSPAHRLVRIAWKETKKPDGTKVPARSPLCVSIPRIAIQCTPAPMREALQEAYEAIEEAFIRAYIEEAYKLGAAPQPIPAESLSASALAIWASEEASSKRLSKQSIEEWFKTALQDPLMEALASKLSPDDPAADTKLAATTLQFSNMLVRLASPQASFTKPIAIQLSKALELAEEDAMKANLARKLSKFLAEPQDLISLSL